MEFAEFEREVNRRGVEAFAAGAGVNRQTVRNILRRRKFSDANRARPSNLRIETYLAGGSQEAPAVDPDARPAPPPPDPGRFKLEQSPAPAPKAGGRTAAELSREAGKHRSSNLEAKLELRSKALERLPADQWVYVPFCGFAECPAGAGYPMRRVVACDIDLDAVAHWRENHPAALVYEARAETFVDWPGARIGLADLDAYGAPWLPLQHMLETAPLADRLEVILTDGSDQYRARSQRPYSFATHKFEAKASRAAALQRDELLDQAAEWLLSLGWTATVHREERSGFLRYVWLTLEGEGRPPGRPAAPAASNGAAAMGERDLVHLERLRHLSGQAAAKSELMDLELRKRAGELVERAAVDDLTGAIAVSLRKPMESLARAIRRLAGDEAGDLVDRAHGDILESIERAIRGIGGSAE